MDTERHFWWTHCDSSEITHLKRLANKEREELLARKCNFRNTREYPGDRQALNKEEIHEMLPYVDFGCHSQFHPILTECSTSEKRIEIMEGKRNVERLLGSEVIAFSYPNGNFDDECIEFLKKAGFALARTTDAGRNNSRSDAYRLKVSGVSDHGSVSKFAAELTGVPMFMQYLFFQGCFDGRKRGA